jgi:hypothetical protein
VSSQGPACASKDGSHPLLALQLLHERDSFRLPCKCIGPNFGTITIKAEMKIGVVSMMGLVRYPR